MLSKLSEAIPRGPEWVYEPKWDGFRAIVFKDGDSVEIASRDARPLNRYFPELVAELLTSLPDRVVLDGEVVVSDADGLDFDSLQLRVHPAESRVRMLSEQIPASFVGFDLLALGDVDHTSTPLGERRKLLKEAILGGKRAPAPDAVIDALATKAPTTLLTPQTKSADDAQDWFMRYERFGLDGVIAKRVDSVYTPGDRTMLKIKHRRTADCVVGGYRLNKTGDGIGSLLLGVYEGSSFHYVGHTSSFKAPERRALLEKLKPLEDEGSFKGGRTPGGQSRWASAKDASWFPIKPVLVCEVSFDYMQGERFRHASRFLRWRDDKKPRECTIDQLPLRRREG